MVCEKNSVGKIRIELIRLLTASLNPLYNHEAKISLFMQIASRREGAALLLSNDLLNSITHCKFINVRFERNQIEGKRDKKNNSMVG